ncbi:lipo-like protein [Stenotrophomonas acidaminiphila]|uniref:YiiX/YebB-like N1pC/P60 family cysteine hydrolase n=1 Tax=Stenotrophomonas TaxID=40323 RepID=UPI0013757F58|nr:MULTISPECIES: YiiX/YebB-like N1pC/P60 family cysteine hydrolase [Stenotrophomonas]MCH1909636.1 lipo-like protein [Stenotrophomonas sp. Y6]MPS34858.1 lipo-like protein [Stenotrophomonas sp.]NCT87414.1 lipo-like protein [Stenotrophomonas acidaminiphila]
MGLLRFAGRRMAHFLAQPRRRQAHPPTSGPQLLARTLRRGDVLLVEGNSRFSTVIKYLTQSTWSHAALYIGEEALEPGGPRRPMLIDVDVEAGVRRVPLDAFSDVHTRICRAHGLPPPVIDQLVGFMRARIGYSYDLKNVFDLARYLILPPVPGHMRRRMIALGSGEPTKAICSTLLAQAFESIRYPILPGIETVLGHAGGRQQQREILHIRNYSLYTPRDFDVSPFFEIVKPRLQSGFDYRALQWGDDGTP